MQQRSISQEDSRLEQLLFGTFVGIRCFINLGTGKNGRKRTACIITTHWLDCEPCRRFLSKWQHYSSTALSTAQNPNSSCFASCFSRRYLQLNKRNSVELTSSEGQSCLTMNTTQSGDGSTRLSLTCFTERLQ